MKKIIQILKIIILWILFHSYSAAETFDKELSELNTLADVIKCVKNYVKSMDKDDARNYCVNQNLKSVSELRHSLKGWGRWVEGPNGYYDKFGIKISNLHPNVFFGSFKTKLYLKSDPIGKYDKYFKNNNKGFEVDFNNLLVDDYISDKGLYPFSFVNLSHLNIKNGDIESWNIVDAKAIRIAEYNNLFSIKNLNNLEKCIKNNSKPKSFFEDRRLFKSLDIKSACIYELSVEAKNIEKKIDLKLLKKNEKVAISIENKIDNNFIITAGNLLIDYTDCDNEKANKDREKKGEDPIWNNSTIMSGLKMPNYFMTQFTNHRFEQYLMPGEKFTTPYDKKSFSMKYCNYKPVIQTPRILSIK